MRLTEKQYQQLTKTKKKPVMLNITLAQWEIIKIPGCIKITIPENMPSLNEWKNWYWTQQQKYKQQMTEYIFALYLRIGRPPKPITARIQIIHYFPTCRRRDDDNYTPKFLGDALKNAGFLTDDNSQVLTWDKPIFETDAEKWRTEVWIYDQKGRQ